MNQILIRVK